MVTKNAITVRRVAVGLLLALVFTTGALAQDYYFTNFLFAHVDYKLPLDPCAERGLAVKEVDSIVYDTSFFRTYTCSNGEEYSRRFLHPADNLGNVPTAPGDPLSQTIAPPTTSTCTTAQPGPNWTCRNGGWLPPGM